MNQQKIEAQAPETPSEPVVTRGEAELDQDDEKTIDADGAEAGDLTAEQRTETQELDEEEQERLLALLGGDRISADEDRGGSVNPRTDCPHMEEFIAAAMSPEAVHERMQDGCMNDECLQRHAENWICCACNFVGCSRYIQEHMALHAVMEGHLIALSLQDLNVWCYGCNSYVAGEAADAYTKPVLMLKFAAEALKKFSWAQRAVWEEQQQQQQQQQKQPPAASDETPKPADP